jgi:putative oxidoreductase
MMKHGQPKLFGEAKESFPGVVASLGVHQSNAVAKGISGLEFFGGLAVMAGLFTRPVALLFTGEFTYITFKMKFDKGSSSYEFDLVLLGAFLSLLLTGGGAGSLDRVLFGHWRS